MLCLFPPSSLFGLSDLVASHSFLVPCGGEVVGGGKSLLLSFELDTEYDNLKRLLTLLEEGDPPPMPLRGVAGLETGTALTPEVSLPSLLSPPVAEGCEGEKRAGGVKPLLSPKESTT